MDGTFQEYFLPGNIFAVGHRVFEDEQMVRQDIQSLLSGDGSGKVLDQGVLNFQLHVISSWRFVRLLRREMKPSKTKNAEQRTCLTVLVYIFGHTNERLLRRRIG